mgnify:CR=1 FL=1
MPKISIILPTYNGQQYIGEAIESIIEQTFQDWELIIVDDCSSDNTLDIIRKYEKQDLRIKVIHNDVNKKLPASLNIGFKYAKGMYLTWTSDDNMYLPDALYNMEQYLNDNSDKVMVCARYSIINENGEFLYNAGKYDKDMMYVNNCVGACFLYKKCVLETAGNYSESKFLVEDYDYWLRVLFKYGEIGYIENILYYYRTHEASLTMQRKQDIHKKLLELRKEHLLQIIEKLKQRKDLLCELFYEFKEGDMLNNDIIALFYSVVPELKIDCGMLNDKRAVVYGAGNYGEKVYQKYSNIIDYYVDQNKYGLYLHDKKIFSISQLTELTHTHQILVASSPKNVYSFLKTLILNDIKKCTVIVFENNVLL